MKDAWVHTQSIRLASGEEALITRVVAGAKTGYGYSLSLDATASRHMAERFSDEALPAEIAAAIRSARWLPA